MSFKNLNNMNMKKLLLLIVLTVAITNVFGAATTYQWKGGASGEYSLSTNWSPSRVTPAIDDILVFNLLSIDGATAAGNVTVSNITPNETIGQLKIWRGVGTTTGIKTVTFSGATTTLNISGDLIILFQGSGTYYTLNDGGNTIKVGGNFSTINVQSGAVTPTYHLGTGKLVFTNAAATMASNATGGNMIFQNIEIGDGTNAANVTLGALLQVNGDLKINNNATLSCGSKSIVLNATNGVGGTISGSGSIIPSATTNITIQGTGPASGTQTVGTINFNTASATNSTINNILFNRPNSLTTLGTAFDNNIIVNGFIKLNAGILDDGGKTVTVKGATTITVDAATPTGIHSGTGKLQAVKTTAGPLVTAAKSVTIGNLEIGSNSEAVSYTVGSGTNLKINGTLTLSKSGAVIDASGSTITFQNANQPIALTAGTITTDANTILNFGSTGNTGGSAFTLPNDLFTAAPTIGTLNITRDNALTLNNQTFTAANLVINASSILNVAATKQLTVSTSMINNGTLNLLSTSDNRTAATIITPTTISGTGTTNVNQYLGTARNWYISSPVTGAVAPEGFGYYQRDVSGASWLSQPFVAGNTFEKGKGYIALPDATGATLTFTGSGLNHLNAGNINVTLSAAGFNLIGNPYPSHLTWTQAFVDDVTNAAKIDPTIWIRTNAGSVNSGGDADWSFSTYNGHSGEAVPLTSIITGGVIPPMQAFWVKSLVTGTLTLDNKLTRSHQASNPLKVPAVKNTDRKRLRLQVTAGAATDETLLYFDTNAQDDFDSYDSQKMFVNSTTIPEIFTTASSEKLVINGMNDVKYDTEIPLGFICGQTNTFSIKATELMNFEAGTRLILRDKVKVVDYELNGDDAYTFNSDAANSSSRFSLLFKSPSVTTDISEAKNINCYAFIDANNNIVITAFEKASYSIFNPIGQLIENGTVNVEKKTIKAKLSAGMYIVNVNNQTIKVIIK